MVSRGNKLVQMALNKASKYDENQFTSESEQESERERSPELENEPCYELSRPGDKLESDVNPCSTIPVIPPMEICDGIEKTSKWISQNNFQEKTHQASEVESGNCYVKPPVDICDSIQKTSESFNQNNNFQGKPDTLEEDHGSFRFLKNEMTNQNFENVNNISNKISKCYKHNGIPCCKVDNCTCSYVSPSEVDDSDMDKNYVPDDEDFSSLDIPIHPTPLYTDSDSFAHRSLSPSSSENDNLNKKEDSLQRKNLTKRPVCSKKKFLGKITKTKKNKQNENNDLFSGSSNLSGGNVVSKKIVILSDIVVPSIKKKQDDLHINSERKKKFNNFAGLSTKNTPFLQTEQSASCFDVSATEHLSDRFKRSKQKDEKFMQCKFCNDDIANKNFMRHLKRRHNDETEVIQIFNYPKGSKQRKQALAILRNNTNFDLYIAGDIRPNRNHVKTKNEHLTYYPCAHCKGIFAKQYLKRHVKTCIQKKDDSNFQKMNQVTLSQTVMACAMDPTAVISKLNVKEQVYDLMKADKIAFEAKKDLLIAHFGESYLKKHKRERMAYACSNRMRELSRLLISFRQVKNDEKITFSDLLHPKNFDNVLLATRGIVGYDHEKKTFKAPSLAMHLGTSLKLICDELTHLILKQCVGFRCKSAEDAKTWLNNVKNFKKLVESRWNIEMASLANKELQEKRWKKPLLLPLVSDIKKFRDEVTKLSEEAISKLSRGHDKKAYKLLNKCSLSLLILFNRRRIGDVQYLKIEDYKADKRSNYKDFENALTETEKNLTKKYKRVLNSGKGSRAVVILVPEILQKMIDIMLDHRDNYILDKTNEYVFAMPDSKIKWDKGDVAIRELCAKVKLENPEVISSNKLRKQIATVTQILNLKPDEAKQFSNFMGHTQKTHDEFYELPVDVYQTAKVSKLLLMMEKGSVPIEYKGKSLEEINFDANLEFAVEDIHENENPDDENGAPGFYAQEPIITVNQEQNDVNINGDLNTEQYQDLLLQEQDEGIIRVEKNNKKNVKPMSVAKKGQRNAWSNSELHLLKKEFGSYIKKGCYPPGEDIKVFLTRTGIDRSVVVVKAKIQHLIKLKNS